jgi:hypothetical protein
LGGRSQHAQCKNGCGQQFGVMNGGACESHRMSLQVSCAPESRAGVAPRWARELRGDGCGMFSSKLQNGFVAGRIDSWRRCE